MLPPPRFRRLFCLGSVTISLFFSCNLPAQTTASMAPLMTVPGAVLIDDDFSTAIPPGWNQHKGKWEIREKSVHGTTLAEQRHYAFLAHEIDASNLIISFSFLLEQAREIDLCLNANLSPICRLIISETRFSVQRDDPDETGPEQVIQMMPVAVKLDPNVWHDVILEIMGSEILAQIDGDPVVSLGQHPQIDCPKQIVGLGVMGGPGGFRNVKVWEAKPNPEWEKLKPTLTYSTLLPVSRNKQGVAPRAKDTP